MEKTFFEALEARRSIYGIGAESPITDERIVDIVGRAVRATPSPYNCQSARVVLLFGEHHHKLWSIVLETLRSIVPADKFSKTQKRIAAFAGGYATALFMDDTGIITSLEDRFPDFREQFAPGATQANGMAQLAVWTALELEGLGASLQHYNPLIDEEVRQTWDLPANWKLVAQMPFGLVTDRPDPKDKLPAEQRLRVFK